METGFRRKAESIIEKQGFRARQGLSMETGFRRKAESINERQGFRGKQKVQ